MAAILVLLAGMDFLILTSENSFSRLVGEKIREKAGPNVFWRKVTATFGGPILLEGVEVKVGKSHSLQAGRVEIRTRGMNVDRVVLEEVRGELSDDLFGELAGREKGGSIRDLFPDPSKIPTIICRTGMIEARLAEIFEGGKPQAVTVNDLSLTPLEGYRIHVEGTFESPIFGRWTVRGEVDLDTGARRLVIEAVDFHVTPAVRKPLVKEFKEIYDEYLPGGRCDIRIAIEREEFRVTLVARDMTLTYKYFPYPVKHMAGEIDFLERSFRIKEMRATTSGGAIVRFDGVADGYRKESPFAFRIEIDDLPLDGALRSALEPEIRQVMDLFAPTGKVSVRGRALREGGQTDRIPLDLTFRDLSLRYQGFPYEVKNLTGEIHVEGSNVVIKRLTSREGDREIEIKGTIANVTGDAEIDLAINAERLPLDDRLKAAIGEEARKIWGMFSPSGPVDMRWRLRKDRGGEVIHAARARLLGNMVTYHKIPLPVTDLKGEIEMVPGRFNLNNLVGKCKGAGVRIHGSLTDPLVSLQVDGTGLSLDEEVKKALPAGMGDFLRTIKLGGVASFTSELTFWKDGPRQIDLVCRLSKGVIDAKPRLEDLDGTVILTGYFEKEPLLMGFMNFAHMTIFGKHITDLSASFNMRGSSLGFRNLKASAYGGLLAGRSFSLDTESGEFQGEFLTADRVDLQEFAKDTAGYSGKKLAGKVSAEVGNLNGNSGDAASIFGKGSLLIRDALLWDVPVFLNLFALNPGALFKEKKHFDAGAVEFEIRHKKIDIRNLAFTSESASVVGKGRISFDGDLHLTLKPQSGPLLGIDFFLFRVMGDVLSLLPGNVLKVDVRGTFEKPEIK
jgi:hypothetical protein